MTKKYMASRRKEILAYSAILINGLITLTPHNSLLQNGLRPVIAVCHLPGLRQAVRRKRTLPGLTFDKVYANISKVTWANCSSIEIKCHIGMLL